MYLARSLRDSLTTAALQWPVEADDRSAGVAHYCHPAQTHDSFCFLCLFCLLHLRGCECHRLCYSIHHRVVDSLQSPHPKRRHASWQLFNTVFQGRFIYDSDWHSNHAHRYIIQHRVGRHVTLLRYSKGWYTVVERSNHI